MDHVQHRLIDLAEGNLDEAERSIIERHLAACLECRDAWNDVHAAVSNLPVTRHRGDGPIPGRSMVSLVRERLSSGPRRSSLSLASELAARVVLPLAAGVGVVILLSIVPSARETAPGKTAAYGINASDAADYIGHERVAVEDLSGSSLVALNDRDLLGSGHEFASVTDLDDLDPTALQDLVSELNEDDLTKALSRFGERTTQ